MTKQLEKVGEEVEFITMLDTSIHLTSVLDLKRGKSVEEDIIESIKFILEDLYFIKYGDRNWLKTLARELEQLNGEDKIEFTLAFVRERLKKKISSQKNIDYILRVLNTFLLQGQIFYYPTGKVKSKILVVKAKEENWADYSKYLGWEAHSGSIFEVSTPGNHLSLVHGENAIKSAKVIRETL